MPNVDPNKTVFISYRRSVSPFHARAIFDNLRRSRYKVFMDVESIDNGTFDTIILNQIAARTHFLVILTSGTLDRCSEPNDWLRREIEHALELERNIVPIMMDEFTFNDAEKHLTGKLGELQRYNGISISHEYFNEGMNRLKKRFLKKPFQVNIVPTPLEEQPKVEQIIEQVAKSPPPTEEELSSEWFLMRAYGRKLHGGNIAGAIVDASYALSLQPNNPMAYYHRGLARKLNGDLDEAFNDFKAAIQFDFQFVTAYYEIGNIWLEKGHFNKAINFYTEAIRRNPDYTDAYHKRAAAYFSKNQFDKALENFQAANNIFSNEPSTFSGLAITHHALGNMDEARRLWRGLIEQDKRYKDVEWVRWKLNWAEPLVEAARKLISEL